MSERIGKGKVALWRAPHLPAYSCELCGSRVLTGADAPVCGGTGPNPHRTIEMNEEPPMEFEPVRCWIAAEPGDEGWESMYLLYPVRSSISAPVPAAQVELVELTPAEKAAVTRTRNAEAAAILAAAERQRNYHRNAASERNPSGTTDCMDWRA